MSKNWIKPYLKEGYIYKTTKGHLHNFAWFWTNPRDGSVGLSNIPYHVLYLAMVKESLNTDNYIYKVSNLILS